MGWIGAAIPEQFGGAGLGYEGLCVLAEEIGRVVAPVPFGSTAYLASEAILTAGSEAQKRSLLPKLADGSVIGCLALAEGTGNPDRRRDTGARRRWPPERHEMAGCRRRDRRYRHRGRAGRSGPDRAVPCPACRRPAARSAHP